MRKIAVAVAVMFALIAPSAWAQDDHVPMYGEQAKDKT